MDMDIDEGLAMTKDIDEYQLQIAHLLGKKIKHDLRGILFI